MKTIDTEKIPIKLWLDDIEEGALEQAKNLANLPFAFKHIAIMPDSHQGYGMPIGAVLATKNIIIPNAVGVDIGCGMCAIKTSLSEITIEQLKNILRKIRSYIPVGKNHHSKKQDEKWMPIFDAQFENMPIIKKEYQNALKQIGTLGGGNHFIEIQRGNDNHIWIMIHSGSRNIGYKVANHYNNLAKELNEKWFSYVPLNYNLAFLPFYSEEGQLYFNEMSYCIDFALMNRSLMLENIQNCFKEVFLDIAFSNLINIAHNYASIENHFNENVIVHRKGATKAYNLQYGIIPGSQGTSSYIVKGKGNIDSFKSCSHGAGRKLSRTKAQNELDFEIEKKRLDDQNIIHSIRNKKDLDEASGAYKNISQVMSNQSDLVDIVIELKPLAVIKG